MKFLKYFFLLILLLLIAGAVYFGIQDGNYDIQDAKVINAPVSVVFNKVNDYKSWEEWGPWKLEDPSMNFTYAEKTIGEGASYSWDGKDMDGAMITTKVIPNKEILQDLTLHTPTGERNPKVYWEFEEVPEGTKVTWGMKGEHSLMDKAFYKFSDMDFPSKMHKTNSQGLDRIARDVAIDMDKYDINIDGITQYGGGYYMYASASSRMQDIGLKMRQVLGEVSGYMKKNKIQMSGAPFTIYNQMDTAAGTVIFSSGVPIREKIETPDGSPVITRYMEPVVTLKTTLKGDYKNLQEAYQKAMEYVAKNKLTQHPTAKMFEVYPVDPAKMPNPADWMTHIYIPLLETNPEDIN